MAGGMNDGRRGKRRRRRGRKRREKGKEKEKERERELTGGGSQDRVRRGVR